MQLIPVPLLLAALLLAACGEPPQPLPTSPPADALAGGASSGPGDPPLVPQVNPPTTADTGAVPPLGQDPGYPAYTPPAYTIGPTTPDTTTGPVTKAPTPTPSHAPKCTGAPTGPQILALIKGKPGVPNVTFKVVDGPYCASTWSFTALAKTTGTQDPLFVVAVASGTGYALVTAGSDVCNDPVQKSAPAGIRVMACGF